MLLSSVNIFERLDSKGKKIGEQLQESGWKEFVYICSSREMYKNMPSTIDNSYKLKITQMLIQP